MRTRTLRSGQRMGMVAGGGMDYLQSCLENEVSNYVAMFRHMPHILGSYGFLPGSMGHCISRFRHPWALSLCFLSGYC
jgi:hypothetical protein